MNSPLTTQHASATECGFDDSDANRGLPRRIRSFVRREGRITPAQRQAFAEWWPRFGVDTGTMLLDPIALFGRQAPLVLEIGFGDGESLVTMASTDPSMNYLGLEVHRPGMGHLLLRAQALALTNLRVLCADAVDVLEQQIPDQSLDRVQIFFPDPWPKARHHKRRLIQAPFVALLVQKLKPGGQWHIATDCEDYACAILHLLNATPALVNQAADGHGFMPRSPHRPPTKFERRGLNLGHAVWELQFTRRDHSE